MRYMNLMLQCLCIAFCLSINVRADGFDAGILVQTITGPCPLESLTKEHQVIAFDEINQVRTTAYVLTVTKVHVDSYIQITMNNNRIVRCSAEQLIYLPWIRCWVQAKYILERNPAIFLDKLQRIFPFQDIRLVSGALDLYRITTKSPHNFYICVDGQELLVHNFLFGLAIPSLISWGLGFVHVATLSFIVKSIAVAFLGSLGLSIAKAFEEKLRRGFYHVSHDRINLNENGIPERERGRNVGNGQNQGNSNDPDNDPEEKRKRNTERPHRTNKEKREQARKLGFSRTKGEGRSHGEDMFERGKNDRITYDKDGHRGGEWKRFDSRGGRGTWNWDLTIRIGD